jgi:translation initiation factor IF-3
MRDRANEPLIRINDGITVPQVRLIDEKGQQLGVQSIKFAQDYAAEHSLDLVEVAAQADPPVCRVMNFSKYRYELEQKAKAARKHQSQIVIKEIKFRPKVGVHDYETKKGHVLRFLQHKDKVKVTIMFRGREMAHPERGEALLRKVADEIAEFGTVEQQPNQEGRNMTMVVAPVRAPVRKQERPAAEPAEAGGSAEGPADGAGEPAPATDTPADQPAAG